MANEVKNDFRMSYLNLPCSLSLRSPRERTIFVTSGYVFENLPTIKNPSDSMGG